MASLVGAVAATRAAAAAVGATAAAHDSSPTVSTVRRLEAQLRASRRYANLVCARFVDAVLEKRSLRRLLSGWRRLAQDLDTSLTVAHRRLATLTDPPPGPPVPVPTHCVPVPTCCICYTRLGNGTTAQAPQVLVPCGHARFCATCVATLVRPQRCPLCRTPVAHTLAVHLL